jgi:hypothetical protein
MGASGGSDCIHLGGDVLRLPRPAGDHRSDYTDGAAALAEAWLRRAEAQSTAVIDPQKRTNDGDDSKDEVAVGASADRAMALVLQDHVESMDDARDKAEQGKQNIQPEMPLQPDLEEHTEWR